MKDHRFLVLLALAYLSSFTCAPVGRSGRSQPQWHKQAPSYLLMLYNNLITGNNSLSQLGATQVRGVHATVEELNTVTSANVVNVLSPLNGTSSQLNQTFLVNLHISVKARPAAQQGDCKLILVDVKTGTEVVSKNIACSSTSDLVLPVTSCVKNWVKNPNTNSGMRVRISATSTNYPKASLPYISTDPNIEPPFYILYL